MRMKVNDKEHTIVEQARAIERLQAKRGRLVEERAEVDARIAAVDAEIAAFSEALRQLLPGPTAAPDVDRLPRLSLDQPADEALFAKS